MYKVGDEVWVRGKVCNVEESGDVRCSLEGVTMLDTIPYKEKELIPADKTYSQGLNDAWELARKIAKKKEHEETMELFEYFGVKSYIELFANYSYAEALAKIEAYKREKEIKVGDVVEGLSGYKAVVTVIGRTRIQVMFDDGSHTEWNPKEIKKTDKHIDIEGLLRQIG